MDATVVNTITKIIVTCISISSLLIASLIPANVNTIYAPGFTKQKFEAIHVGMTEVEVNALLGRPFEVASSGLECWLYSKGGRPALIRAAFYESVRLCFQAGRVRWKGIYEFD